MGAELFSTNLAISAIKRKQRGTRNANWSNFAPTSSYREKAAQCDICSVAITAAAHQGRRRVVQRCGQADFCEACINAIQATKPELPWS